MWRFKKTMNVFTGPASRGRTLGVSPYFFFSFYREHPEIDPLNLAESLASDTLPTNRFTEDQLSEALVKAAEDPEHILKQLVSPYQLTTLRAPVPDCHGNDQHIKQLLLIWFDIYNSAFFGNSLKVLRDHVYLQPATHSMTLRTSRGLFNHMPGAIGELIIKKNIDFPVHHSGRVEHMYISTLLHEMTHAFFGYHTCECYHCRQLGPAQHSPNWANAMLAIKDCLENIVYWEVEVGIPISVLSDSQTYGWWPLSDDMLKRWGVTEATEETKLQLDALQSGGEAVQRVLGGKIAARKRKEFALRKARNYPNYVEPPPTPEQSPNSKRKRKSVDKKAGARSAKRRATN